MPTPIVPRSRVAALLNADAAIETVLIKGWVRTKRDAKAFSFLEVNDGSCLKNIQVIADADLPDYAGVRNITTGSAVAVTGALVASKGKGQQWEVQASSVDVVHLAPESFPLQKKRHSDEFLRTIAHLRPRTNKYGAAFRIRSEMAYAVHAFFKQRGFRYIHTPIITGSDCEGAGELFRVTTLPPGEADFQNDFFGREASLTVSGQLSVEMFALSLGDVYTFGPTFRAENSNTSRHVAEFWMIEPEMAFCDLGGNMDLAEEMVKCLVDYALTNCADDVDLFARFVDKQLRHTLETICAKDFIRLPYAEAIEILGRVKKPFEHPVAYGNDLQSEHERFLTETHFRKPVILHDYPKTIKPFYMRLNDDNKTVAAMDVLVPRVGEIIGGSQREERFDVLSARMAEMGLDEMEYAWYLDSRRYGSVPHSGFGLGFERLLMLVTGISNIRDVVPFPRTPGNIAF
ncbi:MAG: asparagine--tRNA ligase [Desulfosarcinaceae bacterium]|nr:asparagine--tRNA ligase [Desulfosarcinaceae bacterium]